MERAFKHELEIAVTLLRSLAGKIAKESWKTRKIAVTRSIVQVSSQFFIWCYTKPVSRTSFQFKSRSKNYLESPSCDKQPKTFEKRTTFRIETNRSIKGRVSREVCITSTSHFVGFSNMLRFIFRILHAMFLVYLR